MLVRIFGTVFHLCNFVPLTLDSQSAEDHNGDCLYHHRVCHNIICTDSPEQWTSKDRRRSMGEGRGSKDMIGNTPLVTLQTSSCISHEDT